MNREKQLVVNTFIVAIGKICTQFISFFLLPLYTSYLSTSEFGIIDLFNTYVSLLLPLFFLQIDQSIFRHLIDVRNNEEEKKKFISTSFLIVLIQAILFLIIYLIIAQFINNEYKYYLALNVIFSITSTLLLQISRGLGDNMSYSIGSLISGASSIILNVIFIVFFKMGAAGMLIATVLGNTFCIIFLLIKLKIFNYVSIGSFNKKTLKKLWKYSIPLVPNQLSWWTITASDRTIVTYMLGIGINGIYSAANKFSNICITLFGIFNMTWAESAAVHVKDEDASEFFSNILNTSIRLFTAICLGIIAFMPFVFNLLIKGSSYASAYFQIPILMLSTIFNIVVSLIGAIYVAFKKSSEIAKTSIYSAIINIVTHLLMIKFIGLYAASISTLLAYLSMSIYRFFDVQKYVKVKIEKKFILISIVTTILIVVIYYIRNIYLCFLGILIFIIFAVTFNKNMIKIIFKTIKIKINKNMDSNIK